MNDIYIARVALGTTTPKFEEALMKIIDNFQETLDLDVEIQYAMGQNFSALVIGRKKI
jgi:hypothetical protein